MKKHLVYKDYTGSIRYVDPSPSCAIEMIQNQKELRELLESTDGVPNPFSVVLVLITR